MWIPRILRSGSATSDCGRSNPADGPSESLAEPKIFITANAVVADTAAEAEALALPSLQRMAFMRSGRPMEVMGTVEEAAQTATTPIEDQLIAEMRENWIIDEPISAAQRLTDLAKRMGADEVMVSAGGSAHEGEDLRRYASRERTLELLKSLV